MSTGKVDILFKFIEAVDEFTQYPSEKWVSEGFYNQYPQSVDMWLQVSRQEYPVWKQRLIHRKDSPVLPQSNHNHVHPHLHE